MEQLYVTGGLREVSFIQFFHMFFSTDKALGGYFKETWVILNPNSPMPFMSDITNKENEEGLF